MVFLTFHRPEYSSFFIFPAEEETEESKEGLEATKEIDPAKKKMENDLSEANVAMAAAAALASAATKAKVSMRADRVIGGAVWVLGIDGSPTNGLHLLVPRVPEPRMAFIVYKFTLPLPDGNLSLTGNGHTGRMIVGGVQ